MERNIRKNLMVVFIISLAILGRFVLEYAFSLIWDFFDFSTVLGFAVRTFFVVIFVIIWLSVALRSENPHNKLPWLLILSFEPVLGITLFLTFGRNFKKSLRYQKRPLMVNDNYITKEAKASDDILYDANLEDPYLSFFKSAHKLSYHQPFYGNTQVNVLKNGEAFYPALKKAIKNAKTFILFEFFIMRHDQRSYEFINLLKEKAQENIDVKVIIDGLGSARSRRKILKAFKDSGVDIVVNDRIYFPLFNTRVNYRNHRKIVVVDGVEGFTGGMNIANEYDNAIAHPYYFRDTQLHIKGSATKSLTALFFKDYYYNTNHFIDDDMYYPNRSKESLNTVQILQSGPDTQAPNIRNIYTKMILNAQHSIKIMTPYMALDQETLNALKTAATSGIQVEIIIPGIPDKYIVYKVTKAFISNLLKDGVDIYQYDKGFCHGKILIIDDKVASIGSYNLDYRSALIDFEITTLMHGPVVFDILNDFHADLKDCTLIDKKAWAKRPLFSKFLEGIMSIFTPII